MLLNIKCVKGKLKVKAKVKVKVTPEQATKTQMGSTVIDLLHL
jgi:hypothetical protein